MTLNETKMKERPAVYYLLFVPGAVLLTIIIGWSAFWFYASRQAASAVTSWLTQEANSGRFWTCPKQKIGGYPFSIVVSCSNLLFEADISGKTLTGTVEGFHATSPLLRHDNLLASIEPPFVAKTSDGQVDISMNWDEFYVQLGGPPGAYERIDLAGSKIKVEGRLANMDPVEANLTDFQSSLTVSPGRHDHAYDFMFSFTEGSIPALDHLLNAQQPFEMQFMGTISQAKTGNAETLAGVLEQWRLANGKVNISTARLASGNILFEAKGSLDLDDQHRAKGKLDAAFAGFENAFRQVNIDPGVIAAGQALSRLIGKGMTVPGRLNVPVTLSGGFVSVGPLRTPLQIPPLY